VSLFSAFLVMILFFLFKFGDGCDKEEHKEF